MLLSTKYQWLLSGVKYIIDNCGGFLCGCIFYGFWGHDNPKDWICAKSKTGFVVTFSNFTILWVSKLQTDISLFSLHYDYAVLSNYVK